MSKVAALRFHVRQQWRSRKVFRSHLASLEAANKDTSLQEDTVIKERFSGEALQEAVSRTMRDSVTEDIVECRYWWLLDPGIEGHVDLEYVIDETGLKEAAVVDHAEVPFGLLN